MAAPTPVAAPFANGNAMQRVPPTVLTKNGTRNVIAAVAGKTLYIFAYKLHCGPGANTTFLWQDTDGTQIVPVYTLIAATKDGGPATPYLVWQVAAGKGLDVVVGNNDDGVLEYMHFMQI